jgi:hypothetical protein
MGQVGQLQSADGDSWVDDAEVVAEELAARVPFMSTYTWDESNSLAMVDRASGLRAELGADDRERKITLKLRRQAQGGEDRSGFAKYLKRGVSAASAQLNKGDWRVLENTPGYGEGVLAAELLLNRTRGRLDNVAEAIQQSLESLALE